MPENNNNSNDTNNQNDNSNNQSNNSNNDNSNQNNNSNNQITIPRIDVNRLGSEQKNDKQEITKK